MKRIASILLLILFLAIHVGHLGFYWFESNRIEQQWLEKIEYGTNLREITIPINLPYWNLQSEFQPTHGSVELDGITYRKVFQKYDSKGLHILLAEDHKTAQLNQTMTDWINMTTQPESNEGPAKSRLIDLNKEYTSQTLSYVLSGYTEIVGEANFPFVGTKPTSGHLRLTTPPPRS
jgi:hypothetical protein